jgi:hypothetical protein
MNTDEINDGMALLEEALNTNILNVPPIHIKIDKLFKKIVNKTISSHESKTSSSSKNSESSSSEWSNVTGDSMSTKTIHIPSEYFSRSTDATHTESFYNMAASEKNTESNDSAKIIDMIFSTH